MQGNKRSYPRNAFLANSRRPLVKFYTSSLNKYLQAKYVFEKNGMQLHHFKSKTEPYEEEYANGKRVLLAKAINEIKQSIGKTSLFFVEDTSLRIEHLSSGPADYPGLAVKEWFAGTTFYELNKQLPVENEKRKAIVKSDIALHVPGLIDPIIFHGEAHGSISHKAPDFQESKHFPWLTPNSFNGWFIPDGATKALGQMDIDEAWQFDFRVQSLMQLIDRIEEYACLLNAPKECFVLNQRFSSNGNQIGLFAELNDSFVVVGKTCAGKTTFTNMARGISDHLIIEASDIVRSHMTIIDEGMSAFDFAKKLLDVNGYDFIASEILREYDLDSNSKFIITGFRTIQELEAIKRRCPRIKVVLIEATSRNRYSRYINRGREKNLSYEEFIKHDEQQWQLGLLRIAETVCDIKINNDDSLDAYRNAVKGILAKAGEDRDRVSRNRPHYGLSINRLYRCIMALYKYERPMSCDEISIEAASLGIEKEGSNQRYSGKPITANNVNKLLKSVPELVARIESQGERLQYIITENGKAYIRWLTIQGKLDE
jgi:inosine/xanthosine triphosphate pyrophosphatase family protein/dephospho-CoA kinase